MPTHYYHIGMKKIIVIPVLIEKEAGDLLGILRRHRQALPPFHHVEHALGGVGEVLHVWVAQTCPLTWRNILGVMTT